MIISDGIPRAKGTSTAGRTRRQGGLGWVTPGRRLLKVASFGVPSLKRAAPLLVVSAKGSRPVDREQTVLKHEIRQSAEKSCRSSPSHALVDTGL